MHIIYIYITCDLLLFINLLYIIYPYDHPKNKNNLWFIINKFRGKYQKYTRFKIQNLCYLKMCALNHVLGGGVGINQILCIKVSICICWQRTEISTIWRYRIQAETIHLRALLKPSNNTYMSNTSVIQGQLNLKCIYNY